MTSVKPGDIVVVGGSTWNSWEVLEVKDGVAVLKSGQTERRRREPIDNLRKWHEGV